MPRDRRLGARAGRSGARRESVAAGHLGAARSRSAPTPGRRGLRPGGSGRTRQIAQPDARSWHRPSRDVGSVPGCTNRALLASSLVDRCAPPPSSCSRSCRDRRCGGAVGRHPGRRPARGDRGRTRSSASPDATGSRAGRARTSCTPAPAATRSTPGRATTASRPSTTAHATSFAAGRCRPRQRRPRGLGRAGLRARGAAARATRTRTRSQHETQVEPDSFTVGRRTVATFQVGRRFDGAATNIGFSTSLDDGSTWRSGLLPG